MYSLPASSTYAGHRPTPYSTISLPASSSNVHQYSPGSLLTAATANPSFIPPLPNLASSFPQSNQSQVLSHPTFYLSHLPNSSMMLNDSSPSDPLSPNQEPPLDSARSDELRGPSLFDFSGYMPPAKNSRLSNSMGASSYFTPSFPFSASSNFCSSSNPYSSLNGNQLTSNQFIDAATSSLLSSEAPLTTSNGLAPYPALPYMSNRIHQKSVSKLSYDSPRYKLTPERAVPLIKWFDEHKDHPYPTRHEKILLCQTTQLTFTQVSTWFANARRRMKKASLEEEAGKNGSTCSSLESSPASSPDDIARSSKTTIASSTISLVNQDTEGLQDIHHLEGHDTQSKNIWNESAVLQC